MDNLTHSLTGLALARAGLNRLSPRGTLLAVLAANAPDIDIAALPFGTLRYFEAHRGYTHTLIALPVMAALCVAIVAGISRGKLPWFRAWVLCSIAVASHLLLDWTNAYGVRLLLPFSSRWFHADLNSLSDAAILAALVLAAVWPSFAALVSSEIGARAPRARIPAICALVFCLLFDFCRTLMHDRALAQLEARLYGGSLPVTTAALPSAFNLLHWTGVIETSGTFRVLDINVLADLDPDSGRVFYKFPADAAIEAASATRPFRYFVYFARFPVWSEQPVAEAEGRRVELSDLRFGSPGTGSFHCIAIVTRAGQVVRSMFTFGSGANLR
ncbi:MAG: metal-dependent hydrolase [Acidobacteriaceae bacterium]|nr:metal-dependent hydrolase [Acidobacteriaceae bacterium]